MREPFACFSLPAHAEIVEQAVIEILGKDPEIEAWTQGRIVWLPDPYALPDRERPFIAVTSPVWDIEHVLSRETESVLTVAIGLCFDEPDPELDPGSRTIKSAQMRLHIALAANPNLENTDTGVRELGDGRALVDRYQGLQTVQYSQITFEDGETFGALQLRALYDFTTDTLTGRLVGG